MDPLVAAEQLVRRFLDGVVSHQPVDATQLGDHRRDDEMPDLSPQALDAWARKLSALRDDVDGLLGALAQQRRGPAREARGDLLLLRMRIDGTRFWLQQRPRFELDPLAALDVTSAAIHALLRRIDVPPARQLDYTRAAVSRARRIPYLLEQAGRLLQASPRPHLAVALERIDGIIALVREDLPARVRALGGDATAAQDAGDVAAEGLVAFGALLSELRDQPPAPWRMGPDDHARLLQVVLGTSLDADAITRRAEQALHELRLDMESRSQRLVQQLGEGWEADPADRIRSALGAVADRCAVAAAELLPEARRAVEDARRFTLETGLVDVPPRDQLAVLEAPRSLQGIAVAFLHSAPALEPDAVSTYYLSPVPAAWDVDRQRSFLREYHAASLRLVALHEGYPGHFVQLEHAARHPRLARRLFRSPAFAEGWAIHVEREAMRRGFADRLPSPYGGEALVLTQRKLELRVAANALLDVGLHVRGLDDEQAIRLLVERGLQSRSEAESKLVRGKISSGQLSSYFAGGAEIADLLDERRQAEGASFSIDGFHDRLLSHGTPTLPVMREALRDPTAVARHPFAASQAAAPG